MVKIGVVLPYYQREPGLLLKALRSVVDQELPPDVDLVVVVVDDASPCPPDADLAALGGTGRHRLALLRRANGGPGAARNTGLDHLAAEAVDFVAFLDTDDAWRPHHLATALDALGEDADYFFANHARDTLAGGGPYFDQTPMVRDWLRLGPDSPFEATGRPGVLTLKREERLLPFMRDYLSQTSTVVYRQAVLGGTRFDPSLRTAGEDWLFWMSLAAKARRVVLTPRVGAVCGAGVNIFHSTLTWEHPGAPGRFAYQLMLWRYVAERFDLRPEERALVDGKIAGFERGFSYLWLRALLKTGRANAHLLRTLRERLGWRPWRIVPSLAGAARRRLRRDAMFPEH